MNEQNEQNEKINFNFSDEEIKFLLFKYIDKEKFWISKIERMYPDRLEGTIVKLNPIDTANKNVIEIQFLYNNLDIKGLEDDIIRKIYTSYYIMVGKKIPKYAEEMKESQEQIESFLQEHKKEIKQYFLDFIFEKAGFESSQLVKQKIKTYRMVGMQDETVRVGNHVTFANLRPNKFYQKERKIEIGSIYSVDYNPVVDEEFGGIRPSIVVGYSADKEVYYCIPLSTKPYLGNSIGEIQGKESFAVTSRLKLVSPQRMYEYIGEISPEKYEEVINDFKNSIFIASSLQKVKSQSESVENAVDNVVASLDEPIPEQQPTKIVNNIQYENFQPWSGDNLTLDLIEQNINPLTEEEFLEIVSNNIDYLTKTQNLHFMKDKSGKLDYEFYKENGNYYVCLNKKYQNYKTGYYFTKFEFLEHIVNITVGSERKNNNFVSTLYQKKMMDKNENYFISLFCYFARSFYYNYQRKIKDLDDDYEIDEILEKDTQSLANLLDKLGIKYQGDLTQIILKGMKNLNLSLIKRVDENGNEIISNSDDDENEDE